MLKINHLSVQFNQHIVFKDASFEAKPGSLTLIVGKSGTGKSTFLNALINLKDGSYHYRDQVIDQSDDFIFQHVSIVKQIPAFIERLTIRDHIDFIKDTYTIQEEDQTLLKTLHIDQLLDHYPKQLSGGEKTRVALYLSLIKHPDILLLDEPTASLDKEHQEEVIHCIKEYAHEGHIVIASTHDHRLMDQGDVIYTIEDHQLKKTILQDRDIKEGNTTYIKKTNFFSKYTKKIKKNRTKYTKLIQIFLSMTLGFTVFAFSINNFMIDNAQEELNKMVNNEIIVYKIIHETRGYSFHAIEECMEKEDYEKLASIEGVSQIKERFDIFLDDDLSFFLNEEEEKRLKDKFENPDLMKYFEAYSQDTKIYRSTLYDAQIDFHLYDDDKNYETKMKEIYGNEGVYISDYLYDMLYGDKEVKEPWVEFDMPIPVYSSTNISTLPVEVNGKEVSIPVNYVTCEYQHIEVPIRGVIDGRTIGCEDSASASHLYMSEGYFWNMVEQVQSQYPDYRVSCSLYRDGNYTHYFDINVEDYEITKEDQVSEQTKWTPQAYTIEIEDTSKVNEVIEKIKDMGYGVDNDYMNIQNVISLTRSNRQMFEVCGIAISLIFLAFHIYIKFIDRKDEKDRETFMRLQGFTRKERQQFSSIQWLDYVGNMFVISTIVFFVLRMIVERMMIALVKPKISIIVSLFVFSWLIEYVLPWLITKVRRYD